MRAAPQLSGIVWLTATLLVSEPAWGQPQAPGAGRELRLSYVSQVDQTTQPYRIYIPGGYDDRDKAPVILFLHGSSGNEATAFEDERYGIGAVKRAADRHGVLLATPNGRGLMEYRGIGENDVFCVLEEVRRAYKIDEDRIYLSGHSMGGTGSAYIGLHHPDLFAAAAPLSAADSFAWLAANAHHVPFWWIGGALDNPFFLKGVAVGVERMMSLGCPVRADVMPGEGHWGPVKDLDRVFGWLVQHRRPAHPIEYVFEVDSPLHGRAYWTSVEAIRRPGKMASVKARADGKSRIAFNVENVAQFAFLPDPHVVDTSQPLEVSVNGGPVFTGEIADGKELAIVEGHGAWKASLRAQTKESLTAYRNHPVAVAPKRLDMLGHEASLANWITDAMRDATGADVAIYNRQFYRGEPISAGVVDIVDLIQCSKPFDQYLVTVKLTGRELLEILDDNVPDPSKDRPSRWDRPGAGRLVQVSGARYRFDPKLPSGRRIVWSTLRPDQRYSVVMGGEVVDRQTILLAGRFGKLPYTVTDTPFTMALYGYAAKSGRIEARFEGRVRQVENGVGERLAGPHPNR